MRVTAMTLHLHPGIHFCRDGDVTIFLDVPNDRYFALATDLNAAFMRLATGSPKPADAAALSSLVGPILSAEGGLPLMQVAAPRLPLHSVWDEIPSAGPTSGVAAMISLLQARCTLRVRKLAFVLDRLARRKAAIRPRAADRREISRTGAAYRAATTLMSANDLCLPHSVAVARNLYRRNIPASFVIGVIARPFQAHCWVQVEDVLVNDRLDTVRDFTPILVI